MRKEKFYARINIYDAKEPIIKKLTLEEIFFGSSEYPEYPGLFNHIVTKLKNQCDCACESFMKVVYDIGSYIRDLTSGKRLSLAQWMRNYIDKHPDYKHNSILPKKVMDDLLLTLN